MILEAYALTKNPQPLIAAPFGRKWMDAFVGRHPYRCLPLAIANTYGWQLLLPVDVHVTWNGGMKREDVTVECSHPHQAVSNFKRGVITFNVAYIFRTPPGYHLLVTGPTNIFKHGVAPMTALIESDWVPYSFTFNYQLTRVGKVTWRAGEPYAQICIVKAGLQEDVQPVLKNLSDNPQLAADHEAWRTKRANLIAQKSCTNNATPQEAWSKDYFLGRYADGRATNAPHTMKMRLNTPIDERG
jgi:hypothetical protein